jgi:hypothetical protein
LCRAKKARIGPEQPANIVHVRHLAHQRGDVIGPRSADVLLICKLVDQEIAAGGTPLMRNFARQQFRAGHVS